MTNRIKLLALAAGLLLGATSAYADTISYTLGVSNLGSGFTGPWGTVLVNRSDATHATLTFTANAGFLFVDTGMVGANVNASSFTSSLSSFTQLAGFSAPTIVDQGSGNEDGFGSFNMRYGTTGSYPDAVASLILAIVDTSGTWSSAANVLTANNDGALVGAHIAVCSSNPCLPTSQGGSANVTGFVSNTGATPPPPIPEPTTLVLLGTGLAAVPTMLRRRFSSAR